jgi:hypothetical protein
MIAACEAVGQELQALHRDIIVGQTVAFRHASVSTPPQSTFRRSHNPYSSEVIERLVLSASAISLTPLAPMRLSANLRGRATFRSTRIVRAYVEGGVRSRT